MIATDSQILILRSYFDKYLSKVKSGLKKSLVLFWQKLVLLLHFALFLECFGQFWSKSGFFLFFVFLQRKHKYTKFYKTLIQFFIGE